MRIGVNCLSVQPNYRGGINTFIFGLLHGFGARGGDHSFQIYLSAENAASFEEFKKYPHFEFIVFPEFSSPIASIARKASFLTGSAAIYSWVNDAIYPVISKTMDEKSDLTYTATTLISPFGQKKPTVVSMHDIQHVHYPEFFTKARLLARKVAFLATARAASYIQASSEFIKRDLLEHFSFLKPEQIPMINEGVEADVFQTTKHDGSIQKYNLPERFLFFPAQLWKHKNHITVLRALDMLKRENGITIPLIMTGEKYTASDEIFRYIEEHQMDQVWYLGKIPFGELIALYRKAWFTITAVLYESSSLCVLEAAAAGSPVIASATPPNVEMSQRLKFNLFEPYDFAGLAEILAKIWSDEALRNEQIAHNRNAVGFYSWNNAADRYLAFFTQVGKAHDAAYS